MNIILKLILHLFFWVVYFVLSGVMSFGLSDGIGFIVANLAIYSTGFLWAAIAFYFFYFFLYRFIERHQFLKYFLFSLLSIVAIAGTFVLIFRVFVFDEKFSLPVSWNYTTAAGTYIIANCGTLLRGFIGWIEASKLRTEMEKRNLQLELDALRSQVNPHFLFNTLNNIDAFIPVQPAKASAMLILLSDVMRYMLYETKGELVMLDLEVKHLQNVIELQKIRFVQPNYIIFETNVEQTDIKIPPLLFIPFVENACKYAHFKDKLPVVNIQLTCTENRLHFECVNSFDINRIENNQTGGLGLENVKKRLDLLYPNKYKLEIIKKDDLFFVSLDIQLL